eukprot:scaffold1640_cov161-Amphora_coffeaeformis.AAC.22
MPCHNGANNLVDTPTSKFATCRVGGTWPRTGRVDRGMRIHRQNLERRMMGQGATPGLDVRRRSPHAHALQVQDTELGYAHNSSQGGSHGQGRCGL